MEPGYAKHQIAITKTPIHDNTGRYLGFIHPHWFQNRPDCAGTWIGHVARDEPNYYMPLMDEDGIKDRKFPSAEAAEEAVRQGHADLHRTV